MMKKLTSILILFSLATTILVGQDGIDFIDNALHEALSQAKAEDKIIFVDAYTTWCGPCKMMDKSVFSDASVATFFNEQFVNLKLDMEKGEGNGFRMKFGVNGYPSFLFLNAAGVVVHRGQGFQPPERFLKLGKAALDPTKQVGGMDSQYADGNRDPEFLYDYTSVMLEAGNPLAAKVGAEYLETQEKWSDSKNMNLVAQLVRSYDDPYFKYIVDQRHLFISEFGTDRVDYMLSSLIDRHLYSNIERLDLEAARKIYDETFPTNKAKKSFSVFEIDYYQFKKNEERQVEKAKAFVKEYEDLDWSTLNGLAWGFYEDVEDPKALKKAIKWCKKSIAKDSNSFNTDTLAALYYKLGKKKPALKWANKAMELAQESGMDSSSTGELIRQIEKL